MIYGSYDNIRVSAISAAVSDNKCSIDDLMAEADERTIEQFKKKTGITQIRKASFKHTASDFGFSAAKALEKAGKYSPEEVGILINVTQHPDYRSPSTACVLQYRLGLPNSCIAFDVNLGCSGFVYGISIASSLLQTTDARKALVLVGDTLARGRNDDNSRNDSSNTRHLFGDASSAILLEKQNGSVVRSALMTDGSGFKALACPYGGWKHPVGPESVPGDDVAVFNFAIRAVPDLINSFFEKTGISVNDYDALVLHQANLMIMKQIAKRIGIPVEKMLVSLDRFGNTSGASIPLTIVDSFGNDDSGIIKLLVSGFGVGLSWGVVSFDIAKKDVLPLVVGAETFDDGYEY